MCTLQGAPKVKPKTIEDMNKLNPTSTVLLRTVAAMAGIVLTATSAQAATITSAAFNGGNDQSQIVNTGGTVVSAANFGEAAVTINGIAHAAGSAGAANLTLNDTFQGPFRGPDWTDYVGAAGFTDEMATLLQGIAGNDSGPLTLAISGLTEGQDYLFQAYWEADSGETLTVNFEGDTEAIVDQEPGTLISYTFTAGDETFNASFAASVANPWISGYSLQVIPEPSTAAALFGVVGLCAVALRRRK